jgi:hypothetical protein
MAFDDDDSFDDNTGDPGDDLVGDDPQGDDSQGDDPQGDDQADAGDDPGDGSGDPGDNGGDSDGDGDPPDVSDEVFADASDFPDATEADFQDDQGDWTPENYEASAQNLFGGNEFFGDNQIQQRIDEGYQPFQNPAFASGFDQIAPGASETVHLFERNGQLVAFGFVAVSVLEALRARYRGIDLSNLEVAVPQKGDAAEPQPLPPQFANTVERDAVDLPLRRLRVDPRSGDGSQSAVRPKPAALAQLHHVRVSALAGRCPRLYLCLQGRRWNHQRTGTGHGAGPKRHLPAGVLAGR